LDSLNPRHTGYAGYPLPITPNLDAFLEENVVFTDCYTPIARTFPAWYSILTGQYPRTSGVRLNLIKRKHIKSAGQGLGHILTGLGYSTSHFTDEVRFSNITKDEGFGYLRHPPMGVKDFLFGSFHDFSLTNVFFNNPLGYRVFPFLDVNRAVAHLYDGRYFLHDIVSSIAKLRRERRFFLAVHLCMAHWPYVHASPRDLGRQPGADPFMPLYDSAVSKVDDQFRRIIEALKANGLYNDSLLVVFSDHGESAEGHGSDLRDLAQNRVLLAWKPPGPSIHREIAALARTIDIAPTVLDFLGEDPRRFPFDGLSLKPWITGTGDPAAGGPGSVIMETEFSLDTPGGIGLSLQSLIEQGSKFYEFDRAGLITVRDDFHDILVRRRNRAILTQDWMLAYDILVRSGRESARLSLFDVRRDPECRKDLSAERPDVVEDLLGRLRDHYGDELDGIMVRRR
jgi:arylsulfatase A-like enzyme